MLTSQRSSIDEVGITKNENPAAIAQANRRMESDQWHAG